MIRSKKRKPSILRTNSRRSRNYDPSGLDFMVWCQDLKCVVCYRDEWNKWLALNPNAITVRLCTWFYPKNDVEVKSQFMHIGGNIAAKAPNRHGLPGCERHHLGTGMPLKDNDSQEHLKGRFGAYHGIDTEALITRLNAAYEAEKDMQ